MKKNMFILKQDKEFFSFYFFSINLQFYDDIVAERKNIYNQHHTLLRLKIFKIKKSGNNFSFYGIKTIVEFHLTVAQFKGKKKKVFFYQQQLKNMSQISLQLELSVSFYIAGHFFAAHQLGRHTIQKIIKTILLYPIF